MATPSAAQIEAAFRAVITDLYKQGNLADLTVKRVRVAAEQRLELELDWFKGHDEWRDRSKTFITGEAQRQADAQDRSASSHHEDRKRNGQAEEFSGIKATNGRGKKRASDASAASPLSKKQKSAPTIPQRPKASRKIVESDGDEDDDEEEKEEEDSVHKDDDNSNVKADAEHGSHEDESELSEVLDDTPPPTKRSKMSKKKAEAKPGVKANAQQPEWKLQKREVEREEEEEAQGDNGGESEMSSLIDEEPVRATKKGKKSNGKDVKKSKAIKSSKDADLTPDDLEVRKLKDWLGKCGVRKMWARELAGCHTPQQKVAHLRQTLKDVGMDGRPSIAKANEIRERRELAEELEETQKFNQRWGKEQSDGRGRSAADAIADIGIDFDDESD